MSSIPERPKIYHITHSDNLASVVSNGGLFADSEILQGGKPATPIGMTEIKSRRRSLPVTCHHGDFVGNYVPFYFCPRSIMLFLIYRGNHPDITYQAGQSSIVHLEADLYDTVKWADTNECRWAFSLCNAGTRYAEFRNDLHNLNEINWSAVKATDFREQDIKEGKQAEFLIHKFFPWHLIGRIGVAKNQTLFKVKKQLNGLEHVPVAEIIPDWYF